MSRHHSPRRSANAPSAQTGRYGRHATSDAVKLDAFVSGVYLPHICLRKRSWRVDERIARQYLSPAFGDRQLTGIERHHVEEWLQALPTRGLAPATCNRVLAVFKTICSLAEVHGVLPVGQSPCAGVPPFKIHTLRERYLTRDEAQRLMRELEKIHRPEALAIRLLLLTGARKSEILTARWEHVNIEQRLLTVPLSKSGKPRHILLSDAALEVLRSIARAPGNPWLFPGHAPGKPLSDLYLFWNNMRRELDLADVRIHDLRHTFASYLVNAGHSLYEAQKMLGHGDPRTTMRYAHLGQASLLAAAETVSGFFTPSESGGRIRGLFSLPAGKTPPGEKAGLPDRICAENKAAARALRTERQAMDKKGGVQIFLAGCGWLRTCRGFSDISGLLIDRHTVDELWKIINSKVPSLAISAFRRLFSTRFVKKKSINSSP